MAEREIFVAVDVEADGPIPGPYSMLSLGMAVAGHPDLTFYTELKPISEDFVPEALAISGLDRDRLRREAPTAEEAMAAAKAWVDGLRPHGRPVFLAAPAVWDGMYVHWYFTRFTGGNPFGRTGAGVDLRSYWMGRTGGDWSRTHQAAIKEVVGRDRHAAHPPRRRGRRGARRDLRGRPRRPPIAALPVSSSRRRAAPSGRRRGPGGTSTGGDPSASGRAGRTARR